VAWLADPRSDGAAMHSPAESLLVWLGPAAGPQAYEVGAEVRDAFLAHDRRAASAFIETRAGHWLVDLYALARQRLADVGVHRVYGGDLCTISDPQRFYSTAATSEPAHGLDNLPAANLVGAAPAGGVVRCLRRELLAGAKCEAPRSSLDGLCNALCNCRRLHPSALPDQAPMARPFPSPEASCQSYPRHQFFADARS